MPQYPQFVVESVSGIVGLTQSLPGELSYEKNLALLSIESWLVNRDPYNGLLYSLYNWVGFHPLNNQVFFMAQFVSKSYHYTLED